MRGPHISEVSYKPPTLPPLVFSSTKSTDFSTSSSSSFFSFMTKQNVFAIDAAMAETIAAEPAPLFSYPPPRANGITTVNKKILTQLEMSGSRGRISAWVESMKASSPTSTATVVPCGDDEEYKSWIRQHPSALGKFEQIMAAAKGKQVVVFLDYDGTLSPIVVDPDRAFMSNAMRATVRDVARCFPTAIVSGRAVEKVYNFIRLPELYYAGSHGMDIKGPTKGTKHTKVQAKTVLFQPASEFLPMIDEVYKALLEKTTSTPGVNVENNKFCVSVHFRCVDEKGWSKLAEQVRSVLKDYPKLRLTQGRKVLEIRPIIEWDKGRALEFLLETLGFNSRNDVLPLYIGDDRTDEDAFKVLCDRGQGFGILVSKFPKETCALYSLREPLEVMDFLRGLVEWKRLSLKESQRV